MKKITASVEQRRHRRFQVRDETFVAIKPSFSIVGRIININKKGLAFQYVANGKQLNGLINIDIFGRINGTCIKGIPFRIVSDFHINNAVPFGAMIMRQCGGKFGELTPVLEFKLIDYIRNYL